MSNVCSQLARICQKNFDGIYWNSTSEGGAAMTEAIFYTVFAVFAVYGVYTAVKELVRIISGVVGGTREERGCDGCTFCNRSSIERSAESTHCDTAEPCENPGDDSQGTENG